jgi:hypothetical protein
VDVIGVAANEADLSRLELLVALGKHVCRQLAVSEIDDDCDGARRLAVQSVKNEAALKRLS